ncbi:MAG: type II secretion system F family protein [Oscillospiraceae bacterium]|nr:type II secretion system F family protein [Oscillospiraceae bacterium]
MKKNTLSYQETADICRGLSLLLHAGIDLADSLFLLAEEETGERGNLLTGLCQQLDQGGLLSDAMEQCGAFPRDVSGMVRVGERTGRMEEALDSLAAYYEERHRTTCRLRNALAYPSMLLMLMLAVIGVLLVEVLPVFDTVYASLGSSLTGISAGLLHLGQALKNAMPVLLAVLAAAAILVLLFSCLPAFRDRVTAAAKKRFGDKGVFAKFNNARFARALAMGLSSGLPLEETLELAQLLLADVPSAAARCGKCTAELNGGASLSDALAGLLNAASCRMLAAGLRGGSGDRVMVQIADRLMEEADQALDRQISRVEPTMVLIASLLVGMILLAVMLPLMNIMSSIG